MAPRGTDTANNLPLSCSIAVTPFAPHIWNMYRCVYAPKYFTLAPPSLAGTDTDNLGFDFKSVFRKKAGVGSNVERRKGGARRYIGDCDLRFFRLPTDFGACNTERIRQHENQAGKEVQSPPRTCWNQASHGEHCFYPFSLASAFDLHVARPLILAKPSEDYPDTRATNRRPKCYCVPHRFVKYRGRRLVMNRISRR